MKTNFWQIFLLLLSSEGVAQSLTPFIESPVYPFTISNFVSKAIDFDNDGDDDVYGYIAGLDNTGSLFRNDGNMTFTDVSASTNFPAHNDGSTLDIDKNGYMDISFWIEDTLVCYPNYGAGFGFPECTNLILTNIFPVLLESIENVSFSDYNGDGIYDLFLLESLAQNSRIWVKQGQLNCSMDAGYSLTSDPPVLLLVLPNTHDPVFSFADLNNDGSFDLLFGTGNGNQLGSIFYNYNYRVYLNDGSGNFQEYLNSGFDTGRSLAFGALGEFNNDGVVDIFSGSADCCVGGTGGAGNINPLYVFNSNSVLDYASSTTSMLRASDRRYYNMGTVADINLDRYQDVLWTNMGAYAFSSSSLQCFINDGAGTFTEQSGVLDINVGTSETPALHASQLSALIDINIDNKPDLHIMSFQPYELTPFSNNTKINGSNLNAVKLKLDACEGLREGWGARLQYKCNGTWNYLQHTAYSNSNYPFLYLGMSDAAIIDSIVINWVGGGITTLTNISAGSFITATENSSCYGEAPTCLEIPASLEQNLVGYWPFCGNVNDESTNGLNAQLVNSNVPTLTFDRFGYANSAYSVGAAGNGIILPAPSVGTFANGEMSYSIWYKEVASDDFMHIFNAAGKVLLLNPNSSGVRAYDSNSFYVEAISSDLSVEGWKNVIAVYQQDTITVYINGNLVVSQTTGFDISIPYFDAESLFGLSSGGLYPFLGQIDDAALWNRALSSDEVALLYGNYTQPVAGCTDPLASNYNALATVNNGCEYTSTVFVYNDLNTNGDLDEGEPGINEIPILAGNIFTSSNISGYATVIMNNNHGNVAFPGLHDNWLISAQSAAAFDIAAGVDTIFIGLTLLPGPAEIIALPYGPIDDVLQCIEGYVGGLGIHNTGSQEVSGFLTLTCDSLFTPEVFSSFATPPLAYGQGQAVWEINGFQPGDFELLSYYIPGPGTDYIGNTYSFQLDLLLYDNAGNTVVNQSWTTNATVSCAYDPNDLTPTPLGYTDNHFIQAGDRVLFRVRFQNLGNAPAADVRVEQYIDSTVWDIYSFEPAYPIAAEVDCLHDNGDIDITNGLLVCNLENINLPDSMSDPLGSQRQFHYWLQAREDLPAGTELFNQASIFFDSNPPIITNQTYHTIFDCNSFTGPVGDDEICIGDTASLQATQPFVDTYTWSFDAFTSSNDTLELTNLSEGLHTISLFTTNELCGMGGETHSFVVNVRPMPNNEIDNNGGVLTAPGGNQWQWYYQDNTIDGATENTYTVQDTGAYHVLITNEFGCSVESETFVYITGVSDLSSIEQTFTIAPNPMHSEAIVIGPLGNFTYELYNQVGACVRRWKSSGTTTRINRESLAPGVYQLKVSQGDVVKSVRLVVE